MKIRPVGAYLFHADRQMGSFAKAAKNKVKLPKYLYHMPLFPLTYTYVLGWYFKFGVKNK